MQFSSPLLHAIDAVQLATTYAWAANQPDSEYYESDESIRNRHLEDLDKACEQYLSLRETSRKELTYLEKLALISYFDDSELHIRRVVGYNTDIPQYHFSYSPSIEEIPEKEFRHMGFEEGIDFIFSKLKSSLLENGYIN